MASKPTYCCPKHGYPLYSRRDACPVCREEVEDEYGDDEYCDNSDDCECPRCTNVCWHCGGEGAGIVGTDWDSDDPINGPYDGEIEDCPCCGGSGDAKDCTFW